MRLTRVHVDAPLTVGSTISLPEVATGHLLRVLRLGVGDACVLFNGDGHDYHASITAAGKRDASVEITRAEPVNNESPLRIILLQAIARGEKMDWILQKATELGVSAIVPVLSERGEVKLDGERADKRAAHWRNIAIAACEQSGRACIPHIATPAPLANALASLSADSRRLTLDPQAGDSVGSLAITMDVPLVLAIGPEGGWSPGDLQQLHNAGFTTTRLGPRILRTDTAGIAAIAALQARYGDLA